MRQSSVICGLIVLAIFVIEGARCVAACTAAQCRTAASAPACPHQKKQPAAPSCDAQRVVDADVAPHYELPALAAAAGENEAPLLPASRPVDARPAAGVLSNGPPPLLSLRV